MIGKRVLKDGWKNFAYESRRSHFHLLQVLERTLSLHTASRVTVSTLLHQATVPASSRPQLEALSYSSASAEQPKTSVCHDVSRKNWYQEHKLLVDCFSIVLFVPATGTAPLQLPFDT